MINEKSSLMIGKRSIIGELVTDTGSILYDTDLHISARTFFYLI